MKNILIHQVVLLCWGMLAAAACRKPVITCAQTLQQRDFELVTRADSIAEISYRLTPEAYRAILEKLLTEENRLFAEVENCDFGKDLEAYNYWHRGRMKFPGKIRQELQRLDRDTGKK